MENPFEKITKKDWLYIGGAVASIAALMLVVKHQNVLFGPGVISDTPNTALDMAGGTAVLGSGGSGTGYTNYNVKPLNPTPLPGTAPEELPAGQNGSCSCSSYGCAGVSPLDNGSADTNLTAYLQFLQDTNPNFLNAYTTQMAPYQSWISGAAATAIQQNN